MELPHEFSMTEQEYINVKQQIFES